MTMMTTNKRILENPFLKNVATMYAEVMQTAISTLIDASKAGLMGGFKLEHLGVLSYPLSNDSRSELRLGSTVVLMTLVASPEEGMIGLAVKVYPEGRPEGWPDVETSVMDLLNSKGVQVGVATTDEADDGTPPEQKAN